MGFRGLGLKCLGFKVSGLKVRGPGAHQGHRRGLVRLEFRSLGVSGYRQLWFGRLRALTNGVRGSPPLASSRITSRSGLAPCVSSGIKV